MSERLVPGLQDDPERRYTYGGHVSHLLAFGTDLGTFPYTPAYCGYEPGWPSQWLGSGSQDEQDLANRLRICKRCMKVANETAEWIADLVRAVGYSAPVEHTQEQG